MLVRIFLFLLAAGAGLLGFVTWTAAETALHEIEAFILFLNAAMLLSGAAVVDEIVHTVDDIRKELRAESEADAEG